MRIAVAQIAPVFLDRNATAAKVASFVEQAAAKGARLVCFGETLIPAYPLWLERTDGARFESKLQKVYHARYLDQAVCTEDGHLTPVCDAARRGGVAVVVGVAERPLDRGGHTIFCSRVFIDAHGAISSVHRKLMPTYEERLAWAPGDGAGLVTHRVDEFTVGALNCWENWIPTARAALHASGEDLHICLWPGAARLTRESTRFFALEGRSYVVSVGNIIREQDLPADLPERDRVAKKGETLYDGGSCVAAPDGSWVVEPVVGEERLFTCDLDHARVREERQNFDPAGHYGRPDVLRLIVDRRRQSAAEWIDPPAG